LIAAAGKSFAVFAGARGSRHARRPLRKLVAYFVDSLYSKRQRQRAADGA
jgi:hypothetical protein